ncbi:MAG: SPASM domain-containing protein [Coriobacteriia bacterium]|nr:SPASM domain-containing protein [Coriobacteriia bacterium]
MKESNYNFFFEYQATKLCFNAMTCAFAEIGDDFMDALECLRNGQEVTDPDLLENMEYGGFIVGDEFDEKQSLKLRSWSNKFSPENYGLTIAPTLACNFACLYCYESAKKGIMSKEVQQSIVEMVEDAANSKKDIQITWYGGEPLLAINVIREMSAQFIAICAEHQVNYFAYMVTNGYLLTPEVIEQLKECAIQNLQITIDGPKEVHDSRRMLSNQKGTFDVIISNILQLVEAGIHPDIRINVDKTNKDSLPQIIGYLKDLKLEQCRITFGHVNAYTEACANIEGSCLNVKEYAEETIEYQHLLHEAGFLASEYPMYPGIKGNYCCADSVYSYVVDPEGYLYKCWNDIGNVEKSIGLITEDEALTDLQYKTLADYLLWSPFEHEKCIECSILPICMGGCPFNGMSQGGDPECEKWKYNIEAALGFIFENASTSV